MKGTRIKRLLSYLMVTEGWHSAEELASYLHTTTRTIRNYMHELQSRPDVMIESSVRGYRWAPGSSIAYVAMYPSDTTPFTPTDRMLYALRHFLWLEKIPVETLMQELMVSDRTFDQDLNRLRKLFRQFGLSLHRRRDVLLLTGMETGRRRLILFCIKQVSKVDYLTLDFLVSGFRYLDVQFVHKTLMSVLPKHNLHINGYQVYELLLLMLIQIEQIQRGNLIEPLQNQYQFISQSPDYAASVEISTQINRHSAVAYTSSEVFYLALLLFCKTACISDIYPSGIPFYEDNKAATRDCLHTAEQLLTINYSQENFPAHLAHYFSRMQVRQQMQLSTPCTLLRTLRNVHPLLVDTAAQMLLTYTKTIPLPNAAQEVGFLALFLADYMYHRMSFESRLSATLICPDFENLALNTRNDLAEHLGNTLTIDHLMQTTDLDDLPASDLTISVIPIKSRSHTVFISPMPKSEDYRLIRQEIQQIKAAKRRKQLNAFFSSYMRPKTFFMDISLTNEDDVLHFLCQKLQKDQVVTGDIESDILTREKIDPSVFYEMLAVPHYCGPNVSRNSVYIIYNRAPISWGDSCANLITLIVMQPDLQDDMKSLYGLLTLMFSKPKNIQLLSVAKNYEEFLAILPTLNLE